MRNIALTIFLSFFAVALFAQPVGVSTPAAMKKAAIQAEEEGNPYAAFEFYEKVYKESKDKADYAKIGELNYELRDYAKAERVFSRLVTRDRKKEWTEYKFIYAMTLKHQGKYQEAIEQFEDYALQGADEEKVKQCKLEIEGCRQAKTMKQADNLLVANAGKVNTKQTEGSPILREGVLYYSSLNAKEVIELDKAKDWEAKIFTAGQGTDGYGSPTPLGQEINREGYHQGNVFVTKDGKVMYFTRVLLESHTITESKIFYSRNNGGEWTGANEVNGVNGDYIAKHPCIGELFGETVMFFVAEIPGGQGGDDIYYAPRKEDGLFGAPVNLGPSINTSGQEATPFYNNGKLFFSSNGYPTIGGLDVFSANWNGSTWSKPANMGIGVNSSVDDFYFTAAEDEKSGFFVSNREGPNNLKSKTCCDDMYAWEEEQVKVTLNALTYRFKTKSEKKLKENPPLESCTLELFDVTDKSPSKTDTRTNAKGNDFQFTLLPEKEYVLIARRDGYQNDTTTLNTVGVSKSKSLDKKFTLRRERQETPEPEPAEPDSIVITMNETIRLNNIYYDFDDDKILNDAEQDLSVILGLMNQYSDMVIELSSHTDAQGKKAYNQALSQRRAESARRWLIERGIAGERIKPVGYGEAQILNQCVDGVQCTDDEHRFNRRTEFKILEGPTTITIKKMEVRSRSGAGAGGKQSWNSDIYDILLEVGYYKSDTLDPQADAAKKN